MCTSVFDIVDLEKNKKTKNIPVHKKTMQTHNKGLHYLSLNIKGLHSSIKRRKGLAYLKSKRFYVGFRKETHLLEQEVRKLRTGWVGHGKRVTMLINKHLHCKCIKKSSDDWEDFKNYEI